MGNSLTGLAPFLDRNSEIRQLDQSQLGILPTPIVIQKTIVDGSATALFDYACVAGASSGGVVFYRVHADDATDYQSINGALSYSAVNKAGTVTTAFFAATGAAGLDSKAVSAGTLTLAWTNVAGTAKATLKLQPTGSLTETTYYVVLLIFPTSGQITLV